MDEIEGFKMYLDTAEQDRLDRMHSPLITPEVFETFLPFAYALGVENNWCNRFAREMPEEVRRQAGYHPRWYSGNFQGVDALNHLGDNFGSSFSSAISSASSPPGSSSGSGGGFSGGAEVAAEAAAGNTESPLADRRFNCKSPLAADRYCKSVLGRDYARVFRPQATLLQLIKFAILYIFIVA